MRYVRLNFVLPFVLLAGCVHQNSWAPLPYAATSLQSRSEAAGAFNVLYDFQGLPKDGRRPQAPVLSGAGEFWGTTEYGGAHDMGTVFKLSAGGTERVVHNFSGSKTDGGLPTAGLLSYGGVFYGVTQKGGAANSGVLFEITRSGTFKVIYSFSRQSGSSPAGDLIAVGSTFYGTTLHGGSHNLGTVFSATPSGHEKVLHSFAGGADGANPMGALAVLGGNLYGTTYKGGGKDKGTAFEITPSGKERVLHDFKGQGFQDGDGPAAGLTVLNGNFFGTTERGGTGCCGSIFELQTDGTLILVYSLGGKDGTTPVSALTFYNGAFYGTANQGGAYNFGTLFKVKPDGTFSVLHSFIGKDGSQPSANVIVHSGKLYGTTVTGGSHSHGVVYEASP